MSPQTEEVLQRVVKEQIVISEKQNSLEMELVTDPEELAKAFALDDRFKKNWDWFNARACEIYNQYRGKCLCVAGQEVRSDAIKK